MHVNFWWIYPSFAYKGLTRCCWETEVSVLVEVTLFPNEQCFFDSSWSWPQNSWSISDIVDSCSHPSWHLQNMQWWKIITDFEKSLVLANKQRYWPRKFTEALLVRKHLEICNHVFILDLLPKMFTSRICSVQASVIPEVCASWHNQQQCANYCRKTKGLHKPFITQVPVGTGFAYLWYHGCNCWSLLLDLSDYWAFAICTTIPE